MIRRASATAWLGAAAALGYLALMVANGAMPVQRQLVRSEAKGVLTVVPERIGRVELTRDAERLVLQRSGDTGWTRPDGSALSPEAARHVTTAIRMMHRSAPVREITPEELEGVDPAPYELERPRVVAALYEAGDVPVLVARFGGRNPDDFLQYMRLDGDRRLLLMSRFIGGEWSSAMNAAANP